MVDREIKFGPSKEEAYKLAKSYWEGLTRDREKFLESLSNSIESNAKMGSYSITQKICKQDKEYIKEKLEDVGYKVSFSENDDEYDYIIVSFDKK